MATTLQDFLQAAQAAYDAEYKPAPIVDHGDEIKRTVSRIADYKGMIQTARQSVLPAVKGKRNPSYMTELQSLFNPTDWNKIARDLPPVARLHDYGVHISRSLGNQYRDLRVKALGLDAVYQRKAHNDAIFEKISACESEVKRLKDHIDHLRVQEKIPPKPKKIISSLSDVDRLSDGARARLVLFCKEQNWIARFDVEVGYSSFYDRTMATVLGVVEFSDGTPRYRLFISNEETDEEPDE